MAIVASASTEIDLPPAGNHLAICFQVIDLGTQKEEFKGEVKFQRKIRISFELPEEKKKFKEDDIEKPYVISKEYTLSLGKKANLRHDLESWRSKGFTEEELKGFDLAKLLGAPGYVQVIHKTSGKGNDYAVVNSITSKPKSVQAPPLTNPKLEFSLSEFSQSIFDSLPDFLKEKIKKSPEYNEIISGQKEYSFEEKSGEPEDIF